MPAATSRIAWSISAADCRITPPGEPVRSILNQIGQPRQGSGSEVHTTTAVLGPLGRAGRCLATLAATHGLGEPRWQRAAHLLQLCPGSHLLGVDRGLDAVEEALEPADELGLRDP